MNKEQLRAFCTWLLDMADAYDTLTNQRPYEGSDICTLAGSNYGIHLWSNDRKDIREAVNQLGLQINRDEHDEETWQYYFYFAGQRFFWLQDKEKTDAE